MQATITSKGQVTIPKAVRDRLHLGPGDRIEFLVDDEGGVRVIPVTMKLSELRGVLPKPARARSLAEMEAAIRRGAAKR